MRTLIFLLVLIMASVVYADAPVALSSADGTKSVDYGTIAENGKTEAYDFGSVSEVMTCYFERTGSDPITVQLQTELLNPRYHSTKEGAFIVGFQPWGDINISEEHVIDDKVVTHKLQVSDVVAQRVSINVISGATAGNTLTSSICNSGSN